MVLRVTRGAVAKNLDDALSRGFHLPNRRDGGEYPGLFFYAQELQEGEKGNYTGAEGYARMSASDIGTAVVIGFTITSQNFHLLRGRVYVFKEHKGNTFPVAPYTFEKLMENQEDGMVLINMEGLGQERLGQLNIEVGTRGRDGIFDYRPYTDYVPRPEPLGLPTDHRPYTDYVSRPEPLGYRR